MRMNETAQSAAAASAEVGQARVHWDQSQMRTEFANVINVMSTREEFSVLFGMNSTMSLADPKGFEVKLSNRIVLTPFAAKRLAILLADRVADYEKRHGTLDIGP
jgi:uncharacterized protein DUF3467